MRIEALIDLALDSRVAVTLGPLRIERLRPADPTLSAGLDAVAAQLGPGHVFQRRRARDPGMAGHVAVASAA